MIKILIIFYCLINLSQKFRILALESNGANVCSRQVTLDDSEYKKERYKCYKKSGGYYAMYDCGWSVAKSYVRIELFCCDGYFESDNKCELICKNGCVHGDCVEDDNNNTCTNCALGFGGIDCNQTCTSARYYGLNCENDCNCILDPNCNKNYKLCACNSRVIENECKEICQCRGNKCKPGLMGKKCDVKCPEYKFGYLCLNDCQCNKNNTEFCNSETGECKCLENYYGIYCEKYCPALELNGKNVCSKKVLNWNVRKYNHTAFNEYMERRQKCYDSKSQSPLIDCGFNLGIEYAKIELFCCDGYFESDNKCELICKNGCVHGDCVKDGNNNTCTNCALGFGGIDCNQTCTSARYYGLNCENDCNCILDANCNKNYKLCACNSDVIENECKEICKCRGNKCKPGLMGKKCDVKCPEYKFGYLCLNDCQCNKNNTEFCNGETGECKCLENYYGTYCEKYCPGDLKCSNFMDCICEKTILQTIDHLKKQSDHLKKESDHLKKESETSKSYFMYSIIIIIFLIIFFIIFTVVLIRFRDKKMKRKLRQVTIKYSNQHNDQVNNPIYIDNLGTDFDNIKSNDNSDNKMDQFKLMEKFNNLTKKLFEKKDQNTENIYPNLIVDDSNIYSTINENKKNENDTIEDKIDT